MNHSENEPAPRLAGRIGQVIGLNVQFTHNGVATNPFAIRRIDIYKNSELENNKVAEIRFPDPRSGYYPLPALTDPERPGFYQVNWLVPPDFQEGLYFDLWRFIGSDPGLTALGSEDPFVPVVGSEGDFIRDPLEEHHHSVHGGHHLVVNPQPDLDGPVTPGEIEHHHHHKHGDPEVDEETLTLAEAQAIIHHEVHEEQEGPEPVFGGFDDVDNHPDHHHHHDRGFEHHEEGHEHHHHHNEPTANPCPRPPFPPLPPLPPHHGEHEHHLLCDESKWFKQCNKFYLFPDGWYLDDGLIVPRFGFEPLDVRFRKGEIRTLEVGIMPLPLYDFDANRVMAIIPRLVATISIETENAEVLVECQPCRIGLRQGSVRTNPYSVQATLDASAFLIGTYVYRIKVGLPNGETRVSEPFRFTII